MFPQGGTAAIRFPFGQKWATLVLCCVSVALGMGLGVPLMGLFKTDSATVHRSSLQEVFSHAEESGPHSSQRHMKGHFQARCPVEFDRLSLSEMRSGQVASCCCSCPPLQHINSGDLVTVEGVVNAILIGCMLECISMEQKR